MSIFKQIEKYNFETNKLTYVDSFVGYFLGQRTSSEPIIQLHSPMTGRRWRPAEVD